VFGLSNDPAPPPPAEVIVEKIEALPQPPLEEVETPPVPPAPTVIGNAVAEIVILFAGVEYPSKGLAVYGVEGDLASLYPPAPPPPPSLPPPPPPAATTI
tara:strand:+ start:392 stop:691 length:300 start_codon:yes stop_codon:yes gene_type:complete